MELRNITTDDLPLYESVYCNPRMMAHLGGPWSRERLPEKLRRDVETVESGRDWVFRIIPDGDAAGAAGTVSVWENSWRGETINEIGWMILPAFQGRGLATEAVRAVLDRARSEKRWDTVHAFPATANAPSNAVCLKTGFSRIGECDLEWDGHVLRCSHWRLDLR
ncbi:MAG: GNAT family N-acetyltransferase [Pyrinomonadaceae bacterium]